MDVETLYQTIEQLKATVHALAQEELAETGDTASRYQAVPNLVEEASSLNLQVATLPVDQRRRLENLLRTIDYELTFLTFSAGQAAAKTEKTQDASDVFRKFSDEVFNFTKEFVDKKINLADAQRRVKELDQRFKELAKLPGHETPEIQQLLSEADLELTYIFNNGKGATSLRLNRYLN
jgi:succinate dehydrogenase flavin-adding protein (antitoxin of CptAB toxin-antitoxin module)